MFLSLRDITFAKGRFALLATVEVLRRRGERLRGLTPA